MTAATDAPAMADDELLITRTFDAPLALVWRLWEDRDLKKRWWGPEEFTTTKLDQDFRPGGAWRILMISEAFGDSWSSGVFQEIEKLKRIVFTFAWEQGSGEPTQTLATVTFREEGGKTTQTFHQTPFRSVEYRDGHIAGWNSLFNKEQRFAEAMARGEDPA
jgi:uncharacterized protein YndB with AHSA1/START domain